MMNSLEKDIGFTVLVRGRSGVQLTPAGQRILFAPVTALPMASSALRQRLAAGEDCAEELPEAVRAVIRREHLYQT